MLSVHARCRLYAQQPRALSTCSPLNAADSSVHAALPAAGEDRIGSDRSGEIYRAVSRLLQEVVGIPFLSCRSARAVGREGGGGVHLLCVCVVTARGLVVERARASEREREKNV